MTKSWMPAAMMSLGLVACGGGGGDPAPAAALASTAGKVEYAAYAKPSGPLCSQTGTDILWGEYCVEPTSSSITYDQLQNYLLDPNGKLVHFSTTGFNLLFGSDLDEYQGMQTRDLYIGGARLKLDGLTYGDQVKTWAISPGMYSLTAGGNDMQQLHVRTGDTLDFMAIDRLNLSGDPNLSGESNNLQWDYWVTQLGLRTDWSDVPEVDTLRYAGTITIEGNAKGYVVLSDDKTVAKRASVTCQVAATLNARAGQITVNLSDCSGDPAEAGVTTGSVVAGYMQFDVAASRVAETYTLPTRVVINNADLDVSVSEKITDVTGGVYGSQARSIYVEGHGPHSTIRLTAYRSDLVSLE